MYKLTNTKKTYYDLHAMGSAVPTWGVEATPVSSATGILLKANCSLEDKSNNDWDGDLTSNLQNHQDRRKSYHFNHWIMA